MDPLPGQLGFDLDDQVPVDDLPANVCAQTLPALAGGYYRGFTADHPLADAVARFRQRFGRDPEQVLQDRGILLLGPV
jgi:hypothetical protein